MLSTASARLASVTASEGSVYAIGGESSGTLFTTVENLAPGATQWLIQPALLVARDALAAAVDGSGAIYAIGGSSVASNAVTEVDAFDGAAWATRAPLPVASTNLAATGAADGTVLAIGGHDAADMVHYATVDAYDPSTDSWHALPSLNIARSDLAAVAAPDGRVYAIGGYNGSGSSAVVEAYRTGAADWLEVASLSVGRDSCSAAVAADGRILTVGGKISGSAAYTSGEAYGPQLTLGSAAGSVGDALMVSGTNFAANANVRIYFDDVPVELRRTDANGTLAALTVHVPALAAGAHAVHAIDDHSAYPVTLPFTIQ
jgi:hypothetical protein